jgi:hypothetical protein
MSKAQEYAALAKTTCQETGSLCADSDERALWLRIAHDWLHMANIDGGEKSAVRDPNKKVWECAANRLGGHNGKSW